MVAPTPHEPGRACASQQNYLDLIKVESAPHEAVKKRSGLFRPVEDQLFVFLLAASGNTHIAPTISTATIATKIEKSWRIGEPRQKASTAATISTITERTAFTSLGTTATRDLSVGANRHAGGLIGQSRLAAQVLLQKARLVTVEQRANKSAVEVRSAKQPIGDRKRQVHIDLHHQPGVVVRGMVPPQRVDERAIAHEGVFIDMAAKVHEFVDQKHACGRRHKQPADIGREQSAEYCGQRNRHQDENDQRVGREQGHAPVLVIAKAHLVIREKLMVIERMPLVDRA